MPRRRPALVPVASLLVLSPVGAELLAAYGDSTGRPADVAFALVFFAGLYGCPALLARELVRRTGRGWPTLLVLAVAFGLLEAGVIDQSLFAEENDVVRDWNESVRRTYVEPLGLSAFNTLSFTLGHVIHSFAAPIAVAEALRPELNDHPWLRRRGLVVAGLAWLLTAAAIVSDLEPSTLHKGTGTEVLVTFVVVALLGALALAARPRSGVGEPRPRVDRRRAFLAGFVFATAIALAPDTWLGVAVLVGTAMVAAGWLMRSSRARHWTLAAAATAGVGALTSRGVLAFLYEPLVGEISLPAKLAHNLAMLFVVATLGAMATRRATAGQPT